MNRYTIVLIFILFAGCATNRKPLDERKFKEYGNDNKMNGNEDGYIIKDKYFKLQIPLGLKNRYFEAGGAFKQVLTFKNNQMIVLIYTPDYRLSPGIKFVDITYKDFMDLSEKQGVAWELKETPMIKNNRRFGLYKPNDSNFYVIYLNVKANEVDTFNYSISSI